MEYKVYKNDTFKVHTIKTDKFKTCSMEIMFRGKIDKNQITALNFLVDMLSYSSKLFPTKKSVAEKTEDLYSANFRGVHSRVGNTSIVSFIIDFLNPKYCEEGYLDEVLSFPLQMLLQPNIKNGQFDKKSFQIIKTRLARDIDSLKENPSRFALRQSLLAMDKESISSYSLLGDKKQLELITEKNLIDTYKKLFSSFSCDIYLIGNLDMSYASNFLFENFKIKNNSQNTSLYVENKIKNKPLIVEESGKYEQSSFIMIYNTKDLTKKERDYVIHIYNMILGTGGLTSKLYKYVREENSLCYNISSMYQKYDQLLIIYAGIDANNKELVTELCQKAIKEMEQGKFTNKDILNAQKNIISSIKMSEDSMGGIINNYLFNNLDNLPLFEERIKGFQNITKEDVIELTKKIKLNTIYLLKGEII